MSLTFHKHEFRAMGSPCAVHLYIDSGDDGNAILQAVVDEVYRLEHKYSRYREDSLASQIIRTAGAGGSIDLDPEAASLLDYAHTLWQQSDGLFDITSGVLRQVWNFNENRIPTQEAVADVLPRVGWDKLSWQNPTLSFPQPGMEVDFGGYVKEYGADSAAAVALNLGVRHGLVELGGDIRVIGPHPDGRPWQVGVRHPRQENAVLSRVELAEGAVASSGDYERGIVHNGKRYGHILDPRTGWPVSGLVSVTVLAEHCLLAGTACTVAMLKGKAGPQWLEQLGLAWIAVSESGEVLGNLATD